MTDQEKSYILFGLFQIHALYRGGFLFPFSRAFHRLRRFRKSQRCFRNKRKRHAADGGRDGKLFLFSPQGKSECGLLCTAVWTLFRCGGRGVFPAVAAV